MKKPSKFKLDNLSRIFLFMLFSVMLVLIGVSFNSKAITSNDCKMPVKTTFSFSSNDHFAYYSPNQVNNWLLTDIFDTGRYIWSIGDFLMILGFISYSVLIVFLLIESVKIVKSLKNYRSVP